MMDIVFYIIWFYYVNIQVNKICMYVYNQNKLASETCYSPEI